MINPRGVTSTLTHAIIVSKAQTNDWLLLVLFVYHLVFVYSFIVGYFARFSVHWEERIKFQDRVYFCRTVIILKRVLIALFIGVTEQQLNWFNV